MKHRKEEILIKAIKVLKDLNSEYFKEEDIDNIRFIENDEVERPIDEVIDTWSVYITDPVFDAPEFLVISDETGEPLYYQNFNLVIGEIEKTSEGNYKIKE